MHKGLNETGLSDYRLSFDICILITRVEDM